MYLYIDFNLNFRAMSNIRLAQLFKMHMATQDV
jgi:hypothetical protein